MRCSGVVLAGGEGSRLGALTATRPKALVEYRGKALLDYSLDCLAEAAVDQVRVVTGHGGAQISEFLAGTPVSCVQGDQREHVFHAIWRGYRDVPRPVGTLVYLDGDTVFNRSMLSNLSNEVNCDYDCLIAVTRAYNSPSQWKLLTGYDGVVTDIEQGRAPNARAAVLVRLQLADAIFSYADNIQTLGSWRFENQFLRGHESYQLGWGLFFRIALNLHARLQVIETPFPIKNINYSTDLDLPKPD